jgi:hypothetical protein
MMHPLLGLRILLRPLSLGLVLRRTLGLLLGRLLLLQAISDALLELGNSLSSIGSFPKTDKMLLLQFLKLSLMKSNLARM